MTSATERAQDRIEEIAELEGTYFCYEPLREAIAEELKADEQLYKLLLLSEHAQDFVEHRESQIGYDDPIRSTMSTFERALSDEITRRTNEVIADLCASLVRQDERWMADDPDTVDTTEIQAAHDGIRKSIEWLNDHAEAVERVNISYPEDKW